MAKSFTLDLGTNSIGYAKRDTDFGNNLSAQLELFGTVMFKKGVGNGKTGEFSFAAERTKHRSSRRLYQARKYRIWETLKALIDAANKGKKDNEIDLDKKGLYCPLTMRQLNQWRKYDKEKGLKRQYPIDAIFEQWVRLDFDGDGKSDYSSPYELRAELATTQLDFSVEVNRFKLGRALYHIAQRRGFKSSKGETLKEQEEVLKEVLDNLEITDKEESLLKKSEENKSKDLSEYQKKYNLPTVGCAFYQLEKEGIRIRGSVYQAVRSQYREEIKHIFDFQNQLDVNSDFFKRIYSDKKEGSIFYKRPLRSQKGLVGKCTLETSKYRCPISHPEFEKFRAFAFINNIQYRNSIDTEWINLSADQKLRLYNDKFLRTKNNFIFSEIREWIEKDILKKIPYKENKSQSLINYKDKTNVSGCPISGRLANLLGKDWKNFVYETTVEKTRYLKTKGKQTHCLTYSMEDIWHVCFSYDDDELIAEFAKTQLHFDDKQAKSLVNLWVAIPQGYSMLSLKAIRNINRFLVPDTNKEGCNGLIYTDAALLAKIPEILGEELWSENEQLFFEKIGTLAEKNRSEKRVLNIVNSLIAKYKSLEYEEQFAFKNIEYTLDDSDLKDIEEYTREAFGTKTWETETDKKEILDDVKEKYQQFFASSKRDYFKLLKLGDTIKKYLSEQFDFLQCVNGRIEPKTKLPCLCDACKKLNKLYHPSLVEFYKPVTEKQVEYNGVVLSKKLLATPVIGALKNPMAMRTLHELRKLVNTLLIEGKIDEDTRIVVETARDLNDANMRWAIDAYQRERESENKEIVKAIKELRGEERDSDDIDKARLLIEQNPDYLFDKIRYDNEKEQNKDKKKKKITGKAKDFQYRKDATKYRLWLEQGMQCIYTGNIININNLFDENATDFEHTVPRSQSFDNSFANLTICDAYYNRHIKKNRIPTQLENYDKPATINGHNYSAIKPRLEKWEQKVEQLKNNVEFWKFKSKQAQIKETKDQAIRQRHLWQMELDYWQNKLDRFTMTEVTSGFKSSQLNDTRLITKYAYHYLKSVFSKVEVQKGSVTADFRKMLGIQSADEKKNRDKHSHHAIDAAVLSCIPVVAKRDRMLEFFYKIQENKKLNLPTDFEERELEREKRSCNIGDISNLSQYIEENILINHVSKDQTLTPAKRKARKRGKEVFVKNENGDLVTKWVQGDSIRGQLHKDSLFGAIKYPSIKDEKLEKDEQKRFIYPKEKDGKDVILMVMRVPITSFTSEKDFEKIIDPNVKKSILMIVQQRIAIGKTFKEAISESIWLLDKNNQEKKSDKNGKVISPIRHVRCKVAAGKGFFTKDKAIQVKKQTYRSTKKLFHLQDREHKNYYYAQNDGNYLCLLYEYENKKKNQIERKFKLINFFEVTELNLKNTDHLWNEAYFKTIEEKEKVFELKAIIKIGNRVLMKKDDEENLYELEPNVLSKRLFIVYKFNFKGQDCIYLRNHIEARKDADIKEDSTIFNPNEYQARLTLVANSFNCLNEGKDFEMSLDGTIKWIR
jgi:CRISPR-associated endonuclease Csn1